MGDLISRSALIEEINKQVKGWAKNGIMPSLFSAIAIVQNQPTAYDLDKVVAELESEKEVVKEYDEYLYAVKFDKAIDIVKRGGRDEPVN